MIHAIHAVFLFIFISLGTISLLAQDHAGAISTTNDVSVSTAPSSTTNSPSAVQSASSAPGTAEDASDFIVDGVPYAKVLYLEGKVWIRPPPNTTFHRLAEDEPIPAQSVIYTGFNGTLDFATGPGMAVRMVPGTLVTVDQLPQPPPPAATTSASSINTGTPVPAASEVGVKKGTIFSALGREDGQPIDFKVRTPEGVAGARGTMFSTTASQGQSEVDMLHGTVNFQTPDQQASQITAGQSQQISGSPGARYQLGQQKNLSPANSDAFFNHAGDLLEHASGYGVVRHGLGPDVARTLQERGYKLSANFQQRFRNAGMTHYRNRPAFNRAHLSRPPGKGPAGVRAFPHENNRPAATPAANYRPAPSSVNPHPKPETDKTERRHRREDE